MYGMHTKRRDTRMGDGIIRETSCKKLLDCPYITEKEFASSFCKGWCEGYVWNEQTLPSKPEYFSKTQLRMMLDKIDTSVYDVSEYEGSCINYVAGMASYVAQHNEEHKEAPLILSKELVDLAKKLDNIDFTDFKETFLYYADLRAKMRGFFKRIGDNLFE